MNSDDRIFVAGHRGLVGSAIVRRLGELGFANLLLRTHAELDLRNQAAVDEFFAREKPAYVFLAAAKVGGILANSTYPADFIRDNLLIQCNVIDAARRNAVTKLCFLGSSCIYPRLAPQPLREEYLLTGPLEATNEWYAVAKLAGIKMCQAYSRQYGMRAISLLPTNLYGPGDNFSLRDSHVLPALIRRCDEARARGDAELTVWGTGTPRREFLHVDDLADASVFLMQQYESDEPINVGAGADLTIAEARPDGRGGRWFRWKAGLRPVKARRHPPKAARYQQNQCVRLVCTNPAGRRHRQDLRLVPGKPGQSPRLTRFR